MEVISAKQFSDAYSDNPKSAIRNRKLLALSVIALVLVVVVAVARAQEAKKIPRIGYLSPFDSVADSPVLR